MVTCTSSGLSDLEAAVDRGSVVPKSSVEAGPTAPARTWSNKGPLDRDEFPLPVRPMLMGSASVAWSISPMCRAPGVQVVAQVPVAGPVPPPTKVVTPEASAS